VAARQFHLGVVASPPPIRLAADPARANPPNRIIQLVYNEVDPLSDFAFRHMAQVFDAESDRIVRLRVSTLPRGPDLLNPIGVNGLSTAGPDQQYAKILAAIVPFLLVIMTVTGAMYPA